MRICKYLLLLICIIFYHVNAHASIDVAVNIAVDDSIDINECDLCVSDSSNVVYFARLSEPFSSFQLSHEGNYSFIITEGPVTVSSQSFFIDRDTTITLNQIVKTVAMNELVVEAQALPKTTATGQIFKLSEKAKKSGDPFRALSEIPLLNVDISGQSVKTNEGDSPLILIDGKYVNSGIAPIDPKFIESVEIVEVVNAKYLQMGVSKIIDIHLKRDVPLYTFIDLRTRHDIPLREGFAGANFEVGTPEFAISGSVSGNYQHNDKVNSTISETSGNNSRNLDFNNKSRMLGYDGLLLFKWVPKKTEYFSGVFRKSMSYNRTDGKGYGTYNSSDYSTTQKNKIDDGGWLGALYYEHTFNDSGSLSAYAKYNRGTYNEDERRNDSYSSEGTPEEQDYWESENSSRDQYTLTIDYNGADHDYGNISFGNNLEYTHDNSYDMTVEPNDKALVNMASNYTYAAYSKMWNKFFAMGSVGLQYMYIQTDNGNNSWWRPRVAATVGLRLPKANTLRLIYNLDNELPNSSQLSTFNNSTNPWLKVEGNPYLIPMEKHGLRLMYDKAFSKFNIRLSAEYNQHKNMIEQYVRNEGDYSIQSFRNNGSWRNYKASGIFMFHTNNFRATLLLGYQREKYYQEKSDGIVEIGGNLKWDFGKFFIYSDISWQNKSYTAISNTKYINPSTAHVQIAWQATKSLYLSLALPYFWGIRTEKTTINQGDYACITKTRFKSSSLRPWLLVSWTIRKNAEQSIENRMSNY